MKSAHRHELETNDLAQRLDVAIERFRPYATTVAGAIVALVVIMFIWSFVSRSMSARQGEAWDKFHAAVAAMPPDLNNLHRSAQEYPGTKMQQMADITWADGQVWVAAQNYLYDRNAATEALNKATSAYQTILQSTNDERFTNRAHLGLARVYEMRNELDKARDEYLKLQGGFAAFGKQQAERLEDPKVKEALTWLATAQAPRPMAPTGPGVPGRQPDFTAPDIPLPGDTGAAPIESAPVEGDAFENLLKGLDLGEQPADATGTDATGAAPATTDEPPATEQPPTNEQPPATEVPATEQPAESPPAENPPADAPTADKPAE